MGVVQWCNDIVKTRVESSNLYDHTDLYLKFGGRSNENYENIQSIFNNTWDN